MWIRNQDKDTMFNLNLCEKICVIPGDVGNYSIVAYQNGNKHHIGYYDTEEEVNRAFQYIHDRMAWNITLIDMNV